MSICILQFETWNQVFESTKNDSTLVACEVGVDSCQENEECISPNSRSRNGICKCKSSFVRNSKHVCIPKAATDGK